MRSRLWLLATSGALGGAACAFVACSSHSPSGFGGDDAGNLDATTNDDVGVPFDSAPGPTDDAGLVDAPTVVADSSPALVGNCEPVQGPACDLVLQNCPSVNGVPQQCLLASDGALTTECTPVVDTQHLVKGHGCCPASGTLQCDQGLECIGDPNASCDAGGLPPGRCTPHCCDDDAGAQDFLCGSSVPEGYPGHCDTLVVSGTGAPLYNACTYDLACRPFGLQPCPSGSTCEVVDTSGTAACDTIYLPNGGSPPTEGQFCLALNNCADGLVCLGPADAGACYMMCLTPGSNPPFDAGALDGGPYGGGCPVGEQCNIPVDGFPPWISFCGAPP